MLSYHYIHFSFLCNLKKKIKVAVQKPCCLAEPEMIQSMYINPIGKSELSPLGELGMTNVPEQNILPS